MKDAMEIKCATLSSKFVQVRVKGGDMALYSFEGRVPKVGKNSFISEEAVVIGKVTIGDGCFIAPGAILRGDWGEIVVGDGSNIQENVVIHARPDDTTFLAGNSHIGHGAILHGCRLEEHVLVGMGAVINDGAHIGEGAVVASGAVVPPNAKIPPRSLAMGVPARVERELSDEMELFTWLGTRLYQTLPGRYHASLQKVSIEELKG
jgi:carbonic anhydrase/acetyltransferase-like protein (isoleucine patch superfamily)